MKQITALAILILGAYCASAQTYGRLDFSLQNAQGQAISGAQINVYTQASCGATAGALATLYPTATGGTPLTQPLLTDGFGHQFAYMTAGCVTVVYNSPYTGTLTYPDQQPQIGGGCAGSNTISSGCTAATTAAGAAANIVNGNPIAPSSIAQNVAILPAGSQPSGTLAAALTTYGANTEIILPPSYSETVATQIAMNAANVTLKCEPGATLTQSSSLTTAAMIAVTANNVTITGCNINANSVNLNSLFVGTVYIAPGVSNFTASYNNMYNIESLGFNPVGTTNTVIDHN